MENKKMFLVLFLMAFLIFPVFADKIEMGKLTVSNDFVVTGTSTLASVTSSNLVVSNYYVVTQDPVVMPYVLTSSPTVTIYRTSTKYLLLNCTNNVVLTVNTNDYGDLSAYQFRLDINISSNSLTWDANYFNTTNLATMSTNKYNVVVGVKPYGTNLFEVR